MFVFIEVATTVAVTEYRRPQDRNREESCRAKTGGRDRRGRDVHGGDRQGRDRHGRDRQGTDRHVFHLCC